MINDELGAKEYSMTNEQLILSLKEKLSNLKLANKDLKKENNSLRERADKAEAALAPTKQSLNKLTAENSIRLRKEKRGRNAD